MQSRLETAFHLFYVVRIRNVIPPNIIYSVFDAVYFRHVIQPPFLIRAVIAATPFGAVHTASCAGQIRESQPIVASAIDLRLIGPIVILCAIRREVNESDSGFAGCDLIKENKLLKQI